MSYKPAENPSYVVEHIRDELECERLIESANAFIAHAYTAPNTIGRRAYVFEYHSDAESFAFALHCPGSKRTAHLPGFAVDELPAPLATLSLEVCERMGIREGRVLFNIGRYFENANALPPHHDGELFEYEVAPGVGNRVYSAIRPRDVAILTLRNEALASETRLHAESGDVVQPRTRAGDLLRFDNTLYQHSVPSPRAATDSTAKRDPTRWIRYTMGWRAFEHDCFHWEDGKALRRLDVREAIRLHEDFLAKVWPGQIETDLARATFPYPKTGS